MVVGGEDAVHCGWPSCQLRDLPQLVALGLKIDEFGHIRMREHPVAFSALADELDAECVGGSGENTEHRRERG
jgi:hypothetical protein